MSVLIALELAILWTYGWLELDHETDLSLLFQPIMLSRAVKYTGIG